VGRGLHGDERAVLDAGPYQRLVCVDQQTSAESPTFTCQPPKKV
jgi:hypothetical protein